MEELKQIGWWVIGDGKFGSYKPGDIFESTEPAYWVNRGYVVIPAYAAKADLENWGYYP